MDVDKPRKILGAIRDRPVRTISSLLVLAVVVVLGMWATGYLGELGRQAAAPEQSPPAPDSPGGHLENRFVRHYEVEGSAPGLHALLVEFGVRHATTEGVRVEVDVGNVYADVEEWFGPPGRRTPAPGPGVFTMSSERRSPPLYVRSFQSPSVRPDKSYFLLFEGPQRLWLNDVQFEEF